MRTFPGVVPSLESGAQDEAQEREGLKEGREKTDEGGERDRP